jgi:hypothetical protein
MAVALLIALAAVLDIAFSRLRGRALGAAAVVAIALAFAIQLLMTDSASWLAFAMLGAAFVWLALRLWLGADIAAVWLVMAVASGIAVDDSAATTGVTVAAITGVALFLTHPANAICRAVLDRARVPHEVPPAEASGAEEPPELQPSTLRGGRFIGPLERWSVTVLALLGAQAVIVGLMAAKGIGRYPELAGDKGHTSKAEEFLIGSLVSWLVAAAGAAYLYIVFR